MLAFQLMALLLVLCALALVLSSADGDFVVLTPNRGYTGVMGSIAFRDGVAVTDDERVARDLAANYNYVVMRKADLLKLADELNAQLEAPPEAPPEEEKKPKAGRK